MNMLRQKMIWLHILLLFVAKNNFPFSVVRVPKRFVWFWVKKDFCYCFVWTRFIVVFIIARQLQLRLFVILRKIDQILCVFVNFCVLWKSSCITSSSVIMKDVFDYLQLPSSNVYVWPKNGCKLLSIKLEVVIVYRQCEQSMWKEWMQQTYN